jgi:hypothetical protein
MDHRGTFILFLRRLRAAESQRGLVAATIDSAKRFEAYLRRIETRLTKAPFVASHAGRPSDSQPRVSTSRQKASTRALNSSGTSWKGWCASPGMTSKRAFGIPAATDRPKRGGRMISSSPDRTSVDAAISGKATARRGFALGAAVAPSGASAAFLRRCARKGLGGGGCRSEAARRRPSAAPTL